MYNNLLSNTLNKEFFDMWGVFYDYLKISREEIHTTLNDDVMRATTEFVYDF
jgi:hypothetical protein